MVGQILAAIGVVLVVLLVVFVGVTLFLTRLYRKVHQGKALVVSTMKQVVVTFTGRVVLPVFHKAEIMDISVKVVDIDRRGSEGLICADNIRGDIAVKFYVRVNKTAEDVIAVAQAIGCERASDPVTLEALFIAKFAEALKTAGKQFPFVDLYTKRSEFRDKVIQIIGTDLNGYILEDVAIDYLEQTPLEQLDRNNILDAQGIRKITELTAIEHVATNEAANEEVKQITKKNVETRQATLELERQQAEAEVKKQREIESVRARETAATQIVQAQERLRSETTRIDSEQKISIQEENRQREIAVAQKNRERVIAVEAEKVEKARLVEVVARDVETTSAQKALEEERTRLAQLAKDRVAVEKTVAEQEESITTLRLVEDANRKREAAVIGAESEAQADFVKDIKAAEAAETAASHRAKEKLTLASAERDASVLESEAMVNLAAGEKAQAAASGLAEAQVKEADAVAIEKLGLADVHVKEATAAAIQKVGMSEATVAREKGTAEGTAIEAKLKGEAAGLTDKAAAMRELDAVGREHEEFRLELDRRTKVELAEVEARVGIARAQSDALSAGLSNADIDIVGGSDIFVDRLVGAVTGAKMVDAFVDQSQSARQILGPYLSGEQNLVADLAGAVAGLGTDGLHDLTVSAFLAKLMGGAEGEKRAVWDRLLGALREAGVDGVKVGELLGK